MNKVFSLVLLLLSESLSAEFVIQHCGDQDQKCNKVAGSEAFSDMDLAELDMIIDGRYTPIKQHGKPTESRVGGAGSFVPLSQGIRLLTPEGFTVYKSPEVDAGSVRLSWTDGEDLTDVLERTGSEHNLMFEIDWDKKIFAIRPGQPQLFPLYAEDQLAIELPVHLGDGATSSAGGTVPRFEIAVSTEDFFLYQGEHLRALGLRLASLLGLKRSLMDFKKGTDPSEVFTQDEKVIKYTDRDDLLKKLVFEFMPQSSGLEFKLAEDGSSERSLVITNKRYSAWESLYIFDVQRGDLRSSALRLADLFGYSTDSTLWMHDQNWPIAITYPIVVTDVGQAFQVLFLRYPMQAQLLSSSKQVMFLPRTQPKSRISEHANIKGQG